MTLLRILKIPEGVVEGFRAARALGIVVTETDVTLTPDMLKYFDQPTERRFVSLSGWILKL
jgi:hypothetical protein